MGSEDAKFFLLLMETEIFSWIIANFCALCGMRGKVRKEVEGEVAYWLEKFRIIRSNPTTINSFFKISGEVCAPPKQ